MSLSRALYLPLGGLAQRRSGMAQHRLRADAHARARPCEAKASRVRIAVSDVRGLQERFSLPRRLREVLCRRTRRLRAFLDRVAALIYALHGNSIPEGRASAIAGPPLLLTLGALGLRPCSEVVGFSGLDQLMLWIGPVLCDVRLRRVKLGVALFVGLQRDDLVRTAVFWPNGDRPSIGALESGLLLELDRLDREDEVLGNVLVLIGIERTARERELRGCRMWCCAIGFSFTTIPFSLFIELRKKKVPCFRRHASQTEPNDHDDLARECPWTRGSRPLEAREYDLRLLGSRPRQYLITHGLEQGLGVTESLPQAINFLPCRPEPPRLHGVAGFANADPAGSAFLSEPPLEPPELESNHAVLP